MDVSSKPYIDIFIENNTFRLERYPSKPVGGSAISILNKIDEVIQGNFQLISDEQNLEDPNLREFLQNKAVEIERNYNSKINDLYCFQRLFHKELPKNKSYFDIVFEGDQFYIVERPFKPKSSGFALSTLESIDKAITMIRQGRLQYSTSFEDEYANLSNKELVDALIEQANAIADGFREKRENLSFIGKYFSRDESENVSIIESRLTPFPVFPHLMDLDKISPLTDVIQAILSFLYVSDLGIFGQVNHQANKQQELALINRAKEYGYEGNFKFDAIKYLQDIFRQLNAFHRHSVFFFQEYKWCSILQPTSKEDCLRNLKKLDINNFFKLVDQEFVSGSCSLLRKQFKPTKSLEISQIFDESTKKNGQEALKLALSQKVVDLDFIEFLIQKGADISPFANLIYTNRTILELFLKYKIDIPINLIDGTPILFFKLLDQAEPRDLLLGASINPKYIFLSIIIYFMVVGKAEFVNLLLKYDAPILSKYKPLLLTFAYLFGRTEFGRTEVVKTLLNHEISPNQVLRGESLLTNAIIDKRLNIAKLLYQAGAPLPQFFVTAGESLLFYCICESTFQTVEFLLEKDLDPNVYSTEGYCPLIFAFVKGIDMVELLIKYKADVNFQAKDGSYPIYFAAWLGNPEIVSLILEAGANVNQKGCEGATPLCFACGFLGSLASFFEPSEYKPSLETVKVLLKNGGDPTIPADNGSTPLDLAQKNGLTEIADLLSKVIRDEEEFQKEFDGMLKKRPWWLDEQSKALETLK